MLLDLRNESLESRIDIIELTDGCFPRIAVDIGSTVQQGSVVANVEPEESCSDDSVKPRPQTSQQEYFVTNLEPAVWSIIPILDKICVDCQRLRVTWCTRGEERQREAERGEDSSPHRTQYEQNECYDYNDDVDQLFDLSQELIKLSKTRARNPKKDQDDLNLIKEERHTLIRILYCYILPKVQLYADDMPSIVSAMEKQTAHIDTINDNIERDSQTLDRLNSVLQLQQDQWLSHFKKIVERNKSCTKKFLKTLDKHLEKRRDLLSDQLERRQYIVSEIKEDIKTNGSTPDKKNKLDEARQNTMACQRKLELVLIVSRDVIKTALTENTFLDEDNEKIILNYMKTTEMLRRQKSCANRQMDKKVRATSILENLRRMKAEIETNGVSGSTFHSSSGQRPTDVLPGRHVPEFQTLSERVSAIVANEEHPLGLAFQEHVQQIREKCQEILDQPAMTGSRKRRTKQLDNYLVVGEDGSVQQEYQSVIMNLVGQIKEYFWAMASNFQQHFSSTSSVVRNKLQLCYEENFYQEVGKDIANVYCMAHRHHKQKMVAGLAVINKLPIKCLDLGMKNEWWLELFEKRRQVLVSSRSYNSSDGFPSSRLSSSGSSSGSSHSDSSPQPTRQRKSRMQKFFSLMRRESKAVSRTFGNGVPETNGSEAGDDYEWIPRGFSLAAKPLDEASGIAYENDVKKFDEYFGPSLHDLQNIFNVSSILGKLKCLTSSLKKVTVAVRELRRQVLSNSSGAMSEETAFSLAITGDDMLPLIVLMILQMDPAEASALQAHLKMTQDLIPDFLSAGCHGWAMMEFQMASHVLQNLCRDFSWNDSFTFSSRSFTHE